MARTLAIELRICRSEVGRVTQLAVPLVVATASTGLIEIIDTVMIAPLGTVALAALSLTSSVLLLFSSVLYAFLAPVGVLIGQAFGAEDKAAVARVVGQGTRISVVVGPCAVAAMALSLGLLHLMGQPTEVLAVVQPYWIAMSVYLLPYSLTVVLQQYFDSTSRPWRGVVYGLVAAAANIPLNWILIYGNLGAPAMGLLGAGLASVLAQCLTLMTIYFFARRELNREQAQLNRENMSYRQCVGQGILLGAQEFIETVATTTAVVFIGWLGAKALAANQIVFSIVFFMFLFQVGIGEAVCIRTAQALGGEKGGRHLRAIMWAGFAVSLVVAVPAVLLMLIGGEMLANLLTEDASVITLASNLFVIAGLAYLLDGLQTVCLGALRGVLDIRLPTAINVLSYWVVGLPLGALLAFHLTWGVVGIWAGYAVGISTAAILLVWRLMLVTGALCET